MSESGANGTGVLDDRADEQLLQLAAAGGPQRAGAWSALVQRLTPRMYAVARSFRLDQGTADDLVQTAWLRLIERADQLREPGSVRPWLCMVVRNDARKLVTRTRAVPVAETWEREPDQRIPSPESRLVATERAAAVRSAFARLGDDCRQLLALTLVDPPLSYDELAAALGRPRGSLGPTRRRCLDQLRALLPAEIDS